MIPLFPHYAPHTHTAPPAAFNIATPSWVQPSSIQTFSTVTGSCSVTAIAPSLSGGGPSARGQTMRRASPASREYMLFTSCVRVLLMLCSQNVLTPTRGGQSSPLPKCTSRIPVCPPSKHISVNADILHSRPSSASRRDI